MLGSVLKLDSSRGPSQSHPFFKLWVSVCRQCVAGAERIRTSYFSRRLFAFMQLRTVAANLRSVAGVTLGKTQSGGHPLEDRKNCRDKCVCNMRVLHKIIMLPAVVLCNNSRGYGPPAAGPQKDHRLVG